MFAALAMAETECQQGMDICDQSLVLGSVYSWWNHFVSTTSALRPETMKLVGATETV